MVNAYIQAIEYSLPKQIITNERLGLENPGWDVSLLEEKTGVAQRHIATKDETALDLAFQACRQLFAANPELHEKIDGLIFCTQSPDYIMPPNSSVLHKMLGLHEYVMAYDFNLACSGYVYGLAMAQSFIRSNMLNNILLVTGDTYSKYIHPGDRATRVLFGDGASASWITASIDERSGVGDVICATHGSDYEKFIIAAGGLRNPVNEETSRTVTDRSGNIRTQQHIAMDGMGVLNFAKVKVVKVVKRLMEQSRMTLDDIDVVIFHQASKMAMDTLIRLLHIPPHKCYSNIKEVGNLVSSSIPVALKDALDQGVITTGNRVLLVGFGVGLSTAVAIINV